MTPVQDSSDYWIRLHRIILVRGSWSTAAEKPNVPNKVFHTQHVVHFLLPETVRREKEDTVTQLQCKMTSHLETEGSNADIEKNCNSLFCLKIFFEEDILCS